MTKELEKPSCSSDKKSLEDVLSYCNTCDGIELDIQGKAPYVDGGVYCEC